MAKFYGVVGYVETVESAPGVWSEVTTERTYFGDILKNTKRDQATEYLNDDIVINNIISIVADPYAYQKFFAMKYVDWMGVSWKITNVEVQRPRLILTLGGVHHG